MENHQNNDEIRNIGNEDEILETEQGSSDSGHSPVIMSLSAMTEFSSEDDSSSEEGFTPYTDPDQFRADFPILELRGGGPMTESSEDLSLEDLVRKKLKRGYYQDVSPYREFYISLLHNDWKRAEDFIEKNRLALRAFISEFGESFFHNIVESDQDGAIQLLRKCLPEIISPILEVENIFGSTALFKAATVGNTEAAKLLVGRNRNLLRKKNKQRLLPLHLAGISGCKETVNYLLWEMKKEKKHSNLIAGKSGFKLVKILIEANLYDIASKLLEEYPIFFRELSWRGIILETLARKPVAFESGSRLNWCQQLIYNCIPVQEEPQQKQKNDTENPIDGSQNSTKSPSRFFGVWSQKLHIVLWNTIMHLAPSIRGMHDKKLMHKHTVKIVRMMCAGISWRFEEALESLKMPILTAATLGIPEIVKEILKAYPDSLVFVDEHRNNTLMLAILHRQEEVFKLVSQFGVMKQLKGKNMRNKDGKNILHLAAKSAPAREIPGAALQLQREFQWFKAVENYVQPPLREERSGVGTPREVFTIEHKELIEKGEKWMKDNASSCTIVVSLIITVVFAAIFTAPGGNDDKGIPKFLHQLSFIIFVTSDMLALCSSTASLLMFLRILTSSYSEEDFLVSLPRKLIIGLITMFFSIACMMVAFGTTIYMVVSHLWKWVIIPIVVLSCIPVTLFPKLQFPLLVLLYSSTYAPTISQPLKKMQISI